MRFQTVIVIVALIAGYLAGKYIPNIPAENPDVKEATAEDPATLADERSAPGAHGNSTPSKNTEATPPASRAQTPQQNLTEEALAAMGFAKMRALCESAEQKWLTKNLDDYAPYPTYREDSPEDQKLQNWTLKAMQGSMRASRWWKAEIDLPHPDHRLKVTFMINYHLNAEDDDGAIPESKTWRESNICTAIYVYYLLDDGDHIGGAGPSFTGCGPFARRRGDNFYIAVQSYYNREISDVLQLMLVPVPFSRNAPLEYMFTGTDKWQSIGGLTWKKSTAQEKRKLESLYFGTPEGE